MTNFDPVQQPQEDEYWFPYHYVSLMPDDGFKQHFVDAWGINYISTIEYLLDQISGISPSSIIDIGCGDGRLIREIHKRFPNIKPLGVDFSGRAINLARAMNQDFPNIRYVEADICQEDIPGNYDLAILMEVYEHIPLEQTFSFLVGVRRALKKGGILLMTVPHSNKPLEYKHYQHFTFNTLWNDLSNHFEIVEIVPFEKRSVFRTLLNKVLSNQVFVLNSPRILRALYALHKRYLFICKSENECQRVYVKAIAK